MNESEAHATTLSLLGLVFGGYGVFLLSRTSGGVTDFIPEIKAYLLMLMGTIFICSSSIAGSINGIRKELKEQRKKKTKGTS